jgi:hypothetical protein
MPENFKHSLKASSNGFEYHLGDGLVYTAMAMGYENATLQDSPIANTNYAFSLAIAMEPPTVLTSDVTGITLTTANCGGTVITEGDAPVTARGVCWATTPSPLATGSHTTDGSGTGAFVSNMTGLTVGTYYYVRAYAATSVDTSYGDELCFYTFFPCGSAITKNHIAGAVAPVSKTVTYGTVTNIPGEPAKCWITSNLGADHQATAVDDTTEASAGWYWQFNRKQGFKHDGSTRTPNTTWIENIPAATNWLPANDPCALEFGSDWRLPTGTEWTNVDASGGWTNWNGPWNSGLKLHTAGYLDYNNGSRLKRGIAGHYWSSRSYDFYDGWQLSFEINKSLIYNRYIAFGYSVRCLREAGDQATLPIITTASITYITQSTAISGGNVTSDGGALVTARGVCWSTSANPTIANSYTISGDETGLFASNITELSENTLYYVRAYATNSVGTAYGDELLFYTLPIFSCGSAITINHIAGAIAPINKTVTYSTVTNIPGEPNKCWITSNLGADHQATTVDDTTASSAGWYWQFNRKQGFQIDGTMLIPEEKWVYWELIENCNWYHSNDPCGYELGGSWRIPTYTEWYNVDISGNWHDWAGPWDSGLKLHAAGIIYYYSFGIQFESLIGGYWSTDQSQSDSHYGYGLVFTSDYSKLKNDLYKGYGLSVRCLRD